MSSMGVFNCNVCKFLREVDVCTKFNIQIKHPFSVYKPMDFCSFHERKEEGDEVVNYNHKGIKIDLQT